MVAAILAALEAAAPTVLPALFKAIFDIITAWLSGRIDTPTALQRMHDAVDEAGKNMASFDQQLTAQHAEFAQHMQDLEAKQAALQASTPPQKATP